MTEMERELGWLWSWKHWAVVVAIGAAFGGLIILIADALNEI